MDFIQSFAQDIKHGLRLMRRQPGFTAASISTLGLGIGAATVIFSVINGVLLKPLPYPDSNQIVQIWQIGDSGGKMSFSDPNYSDLEAESHSYSFLARHTTWTSSVIAENEPVRTRVSRVSTDFLEVMGTSPEFGRSFNVDDHIEGAEATILVGHEFWVSYLNASADLSALSLSIGGISYQVIGVMPDGFDFPSITSLWIPYNLRGTNSSRTSHNASVVGRLSSNITYLQADEEIKSLAARWNEAYGDDTWMADGRVLSLKEEQVGDVRPALLILFGAVGLLLAIACLNVANLMLARATTRQQELSIRAALGANRRRLLQQFLSESTLIAVGGGSLGILVAAGGISLLRYLEPQGLPRLEGISIDVTVFLFSFVIAALTSISLSLLTSLRPSGSDLISSLRERDASDSGTISKTRLRGALVVLQISITLVLLVGSGLLGRSLLLILNQDPGFRTEGVLIMDLPWSGSSDDEVSLQRARLYEELMERLRGMPEVISVGGVSSLPLSGSRQNGQFLKMMPGEEISDFDEYIRLSKIPARQGYAEYRVADGKYFETMGIPLVSGRLFEQRDVLDAPHAALISESLAREEWPDIDPIGSPIQFGNMDGDFTFFNIVGVVGDVRDRGLDLDPRPTFYACFRQRPNAVSSFSIVMHNSGAVQPLQTAARSILRELDPTIPIRFREVSKVYTGSISDRSFNLLLIGVFGAAGLLLALMGIFGVTSYSVAQRRREIGVRIAIGATNRQVFRLIIGNGILHILLGLLLGSIGAVIFSSMMSSLLYGVGTVDPLTYIVAIVTITGTALLAHMIPARNATQIDPIRAVQSE